MNNDYIEMNRFERILFNLGLISIHILLFLFLRYLCLEYLIYE